MVEMIKPERPKFETERVDILRWEEDHGTIIQCVIGKGENQWRKNWVYGWTATRRLL